MSINPFNLLGQYSKVRDEAKAMEAKLESLRIYGYATDMITITLNGKLNLIDIKINPSVIQKHTHTDIEELIKLAFKDAQDKSKNIITNELKLTNPSILQSLLKNMS